MTAPDSDLLRVWFRVAREGGAAPRVATMREDDDGIDNALRDRGEGTIILTHAMPGDFRLLIRGNDGRFYTAMPSNVRGAIRVEPDAWQWAHQTDRPGIYVIEDGATPPEEYTPWAKALADPYLTDRLRERGWEPAGPWEPTGEKDTFHLRRPLRQLKFEDPR